MLWDPNMVYSQGDMVLYFKQESSQTSVEFGRREYMFILVSMEPGNNAIPNYDMVGEIPDFSKSGWRLLNPTSYLLQNVNAMRDVVEEVFSSLLSDHLAEDHGMEVSHDLDNSLVRRDLSNLHSGWSVGSRTVQIGGD